MTELTATIGSVFAFGAGLFCIAWSFSKRKRATEDTPEVFGWTAFDPKREAHFRPLRDV